MRQAFQNVVAKSNSAAKTLLAGPSTTHNYVRFAPQNEDQLLELHNRGYDLFDVPLDQDMVDWGEYYQDPSLPVESITYQYTLVPDNYALPTAVPYIIISQVFLFNEDAGDESDPETDPWIPDPPPDGYCYDEYGQAYICGTDPRAYLRTKERLPEDLYKKATKELLDAGVNLKELYNEAMRLAGMEEEMIDTGSTSGRTKVTRYYPSGHIRVTNNSTGLTVPVRNIKVKSRRFFKIDDAYTDARGYFQINKGYKQKAYIVLKFQNPQITVRAISGALKLWEYAQVLERECGLFSTNQLGGINITLTYNSNADTYGALQWAGAHCLNTHFEMKQYCAQQSIPGPYPFLNTWISSSWTQGASAPMLRAVANTSQVSLAIDYLLLGWGTVVKRIVQNFLPDVTLRLQGSGGTTRSASDLSNTFFHEFAHSIHYDKVGNTYWAEEIAYTVANMGYGNKTTNGAGRAAVVESWGFFVGSTFNRTKYTRSFPSIAEGERLFLENQQRNDNVSFSPFNGTISQGWIPWGMLHDLTDTGEPSVTLINDQVNGYTVEGIFRGFDQGSTTVPALRDAILVNNGNSQLSQVNQLVTSYGW